MEQVDGHLKSAGNAASNSTLLVNALQDLSERATAQERQILEFVRTQAGSSIQVVSAALNVSYPTTRRYVRRLVRGGWLAELKFGNQNLLFDPIVSRRTVLLEILRRDPKKARVVDTLRSIQNNPTSMNRLADLAGVDFQHAKRVLVAMADVGLIRVQHDHGRYTIHLIAESLDRTHWTA